MAEIDRRVIEKINKINKTPKGDLPSDSDERIALLCWLWIKNREIKEQGDRDRYYICLDKFIKIVIPLKQLIDEGAIALQDLKDLGLSDRPYQMLAELSYLDLREKTKIEKINIFDDAFKENLPMAMAEFPRNSPASNSSFCFDHRTEATCQ